jgi:2-oxoglutarate ferredoxin oxidoreductase subunit alpha
MAELPLIVVDVQRVGPSTGIPTKTEQADLLQAIWGRHGESPLAVIAAASPADCFDAAFEAARIALKYMLPVIVLSDGLLGNGSEIWRVPEIDALPRIPVRQVTDPEGFAPYKRDPETLARPWAIPGTPKLEHRLGGLEKEDVSGVVSGAAENHEKMVRIRAEKLERIARDIPLPEVYGDPKAPVLVLGWGSTFGVIRQAVEKLRAEGLDVAGMSLRHLNPLPAGLDGLLKGYRRVIVAENNSGQLWYHLRGKFLLDAERLNKVQGQPFRSSEIEAAVRASSDTRCAR